MAGTFRESMGGLHTWAGLVFSWMLFFMFVTGTLGYFDTEIDRWMQPELPVSQPVPTEQAVRTAQQFLQENHAGAKAWHIALPQNRNIPWLRVGWRYPSPDKGGPETGPRSGRMMLDAVTGEALSGRDTGGGQQLYKMHWRLAYLPRSVSDRVVGVFTMLMLLALITGVIIHRNIFRDFFTFRPRKRQRSWLDLHNLASVASLPFQLMITYSGLLFFLTMYMPLIVAGSYGFDPEKARQFRAEIFPGEQVARQQASKPMVDLTRLFLDAEQRAGTGHVERISVHWPGEAGARIDVKLMQTGLVRNADALTYDADGQRFEKARLERPPQTTFLLAMLGLHEGKFSSTGVRWLYFLSGLLGTLMIASGLILWAVKRRGRQLKKATPDRGFMLVERLNAGTMTGVMIGVAAYFWANRLLPLEMEARASWEQHVMFLSWLAAMLYACWRPIRLCWIELSAVASVAYLALPLVNLLTTDRHLVWSLAEQNWVFAGVDLAFLVTGGLFAVAAWGVHCSWKELPGTPAARRRKAVERSEVVA